MAAKKVGLVPLTKEEYTAALKTFSDNSTQFECQLEMTRPVVESFKGKPIDFMSIGAGTGCFEDDLVTKLGLNVSNFHAVEPNDEHREQLKQTVIGWANIKLTVDQNYFTENYEVETKFDLILMCHCLYQMSNIDLVILKAISLLKAEGKIVIFMHSETGVDSVLYLRVMESMEYLSRPLSDESITGESVCEILAKNSICFTTSEGLSEVDVTQFIKRQNTPTANDVVSLFVHARFEKLPEELRKDLYAMVKERVIHTEDDKYMLPFPTVMITIEKI